METAVVGKASSSDFRLTLRFIVVGLVATATYAVGTLAFNHTSVGVDPVAANTLGFALSIVVSYVGHHRYTFRVSGRHGFYFPRFVFVTTGLFLMSTLVTYLATHQFSTSPVSATFAISAMYPIASYLLNSLWTFRRRPSKDNDQVDF